MRRRRLLALVTAVATGGCVGGGDDFPPDDIVTPAPVPTGTPRREQSASFAIVSAAVQPGIALVDAGAVDILDEAGQYLVVTLAGDVPDRSAFEFRFDGRTYRPDPPQRRRYRDDESGTDLVFPLPETGTGTDAVLRWPDGAWGPPPTVVERLEAPLPSFAVTLDGPATATEGSDPNLVVDVTNVGGTDGRYVLALNRWESNAAYTPVDRLGGELAADESEVRLVDAAVPAEGESARYTLDVPGERGRRHHIISESGTTPE